MRDDSKIEGHKTIVMFSKAIKSKGLTETRPPVLMGLDTKRWIHDLLKVTLKQGALGTGQMAQWVNQRAEGEQLEEGVQDMENKGDNRGQAYLEGGLSDGVEISNHRWGKREG